MLAYIFGYLAARVITSLVRAVVRTAVVRKGGSPVITLDLRSARIASPRTLCASCVFSHIIAGYAQQEQIVFCGYAFPLREIPFAVKDCTDFKTEHPIGIDVLRLQET